jgi:hypothetical protein
MILGSNREKPQAISEGKPHRVALVLGWYLGSLVSITEDS